MDEDSKIKNELAGDLTGLFFKAAENLGLNQMSKETTNEVDKEDESEAEDEGDIFEVDYLMDTKVKKGIRYFHVRWKGYDESEDSWEPEENLEGAKDIVANFMIDYNSKKGKPKARGSATRPPPKKRGRPSKSEASDPEPEEKEDEKEDERDDDYDGGRTPRKTKVGHPPKTDTANAFSKSSLANCIKRKATTSHLRWLDSDSDDSDDDKSQSAKEASKPDGPTSTKSLSALPESKSLVKLPNLSLPSTSLQAAESTADTSPPSSQKSKKKKKKNKKHKERDRSRSRSRSSEPPNQPSTTSNFVSQPGTSLTFLGGFLSEDSSDIKFVAKNPSNQQLILTLNDAFQSDGLALCQFLASKVEFQPQGQLKVKLNKMNGV
ncbi:unnamed protein product [Bursaphelenchus xylophilus]|uniref:(pine wood nematode) hypothetical protein n=1 Tax=Bursaphelenchus xylophilus TaxID=6326 RepID=A0A1I7SDF9_BURXY|nr:unnamed protein product [Bursaphelenchus xylophilus]CAG9130665.1 unnamed protein product [Bursaphelenchus xylophilus]